MATGFSVMDALNKNSKAGVDESPRARFRTKDISIFKMYRNKLNFYYLPGIEELAGDILMYGLKQNLEVVFEPSEQGEYRIVAGERRWLALKYLVKQGYKEFEIATCKLTTPQDEDEEQVEIIIANAYRTKSLKDVIEEEQRLKACLERMKTDGKKIKGYDLQSGRLRDVIASMLKMSKTKIAQIESVNNNLIPEFREELNNERLTFSAAYELSGMSPEMQQEALAKYKENGELSYTEIKDMKSPQKPEQEQDAAGQQDTVSESDTAGQQDAEISMNPLEENPAAGEDYQTPHPEGITSICYSCTEYETAKKLREMEDDKKMQNLPSDESDKKKFIRMSVDGFERVVNGEQQYIITKNDGFKKGQEITIGEFAEGKATGRTLEMFISYMDDEKSSSALEDGYCVLSVHEAYRFCDQCEYFDRVNVSPDGMSACSHDTLNHYCEEQACHRFKRKRLHVDGGEQGNENDIH